MLKVLFFPPLRMTRYPSILQRLLLAFQPRVVTLEELRPHRKRAEVLKTASPDYRLALYEQLTVFIYESEDKDGKDRTREFRRKLMQLTLGEKNKCAFDVTPMEGLRDRAKRLPTPFHKSENG